MAKELKDGGSMDVERFSEEMVAEAGLTSSSISSEHFGTNVVPSSVNNSLSLSAKILLFNKLPIRSIILPQRSMTALFQNLAFPISMM